MQRINTRTRTHADAIVKGMQSAGKLAKICTEGEKVMKERTASAKKGLAALLRSLKDMQKKMEKASQTGFTRQSASTLTALADSIEKQLTAYENDVRLAQNAGTKAVKLAQREGYEKGVNETVKQRKERKTQEKERVKFFEELYKKLQSKLTPLVQQVATKHAADIQSRGHVSTSLSDEIYDLVSENLNVIKSNQNYEILHINTRNITDFIHDKIKPQYTKMLENERKLIQQKENEKQKKLAQEILNEEEFTSYNSAAFGELLRKMLISSSSKIFSMADDLARDIIFNGLNKEKFNKYKKSIKEMCTEQCAQIGITENDILKEFQKGFWNYAEGRLDNQKREQKRAKMQQERRSRGG